MDSRASVMLVLRLIAFRYQLNIRVNNEVKMILREKVKGLKSEFFSLSNKFDSRSQ